MAEQLSDLENMFRSCDGERRDEVGDQLRGVGRRALEMVDQACLKTWKQSGSCQVETSSLTITLSTNMKEVRG